MRLHGRHVSHMVRKVSSSRSGAETARSALFYAAIFSTAFTLFWVEATATSYISELPNHLALAISHVAPAPLSFRIPHPGFHWCVLLVNGVFRVGLAQAGVLVLAMTVTLYAALVLRVVSATTTALELTVSPRLVTTALLLVSAIYFPAVDPDFYLGQGSPNFWAVPTLVMVKPLALWSVVLLAELLDGSGRTSLSRWAGVFAVSLLLGVLMKPSFFIAFGPVAGVMLLWSYRRLGARAVAAGLMAFAPSVALLGYQYLTNYHAAQSKIVVTWFGPWSLYSNNILGSMVLAMAFPLGILVTRFRSVVNDAALRTSWLFQLVATFQFAFFAEQKYFEAANFAWGYNLGLTLLFVFSTLEFVRWLGGEHEPTRAVRMQLWGLSAIFGLHLVSGVVYLLRQLNGMSYT